MFVLPLLRENKTPGCPIQGFSKMTLSSLQAPAPRVDFIRVVSRQNLVRVENGAIPLVPRIEERAWTQLSVALRSAKVLFRRGSGLIRHPYIRMGEGLVRIRQPDRNDDAARPVDPEKERARRRWSEFCSPGFPSATQDACGPRGSSRRIQKANVSDGVHSRQ